MRGEDEGAGGAALLVIGWATPLLDPRRANGFGDERQLLGGQQAAAAKEARSWPVGCTPCLARPRIG